MFGSYIIARENGRWLAKHPASPSHSPLGSGYRCEVEGCRRIVVRRDSARSGWAHAPAPRKKVK